MFNLRMLILSKGFKRDTQQDLLEIVSSSTWLEDLIDYAGNLDGKEKDEDDCETCDRLDDLESEKSTLSNDFDEFKDEIADLIIKLKKEIEDDVNEHFIKNANEEHLIFAFSDAVEKLSLKRKNGLEEENTVVIGGIECPK